MQFKVQRVYVSILIQQAAFEVNRFESSLYFIIFFVVSPTLRHGPLICYSFGAIGLKTDIRRQESDSSKIRNQS